MKISCITLTAGSIGWLFVVVVGILPSSEAWIPSSLVRIGRVVNGGRLGMPNTSSCLSSSTNSNDNMMNSMKQQAMDQMKNLTPQQIDQMLLEMETMNPIQKSALKAMGMDLEAMKSSMKMMKENPAMIQVAQQMMEKMTPEQLMEQSKRAQEQMKNMTPQQVATANAAMSSIPKEQLEQAMQVIQNQQAQTSRSDSTISVTADDDDDDDEVSVTSTTTVNGYGSSTDPNVITAMYQVAEFMSRSGASGGGVTFSGFSSLPPIQLLLGDKEEDLSWDEWKECWATGSLGATTVDMQGFERVWKEVQDFFEEDVMDEARKEATKRTKGLPAKKIRGATKTTSTTTTPSPMVGASLDPNQLETMNQAIKNMKEDDLVQMFDAMQNMDAATEARLKAMGTDPAILKKTASLLNSNPAMRKAAQEMMKNMSPQDMVKMSQQAQEQMKNMTPEQIQQAMDLSPELQKSFEGMSMDEIQQAMKGGNYGTGSK